MVIWSQSDNTNTLSALKEQLANESCNEAEVVMKQVQRLTQRTHLLNKLVLCSLVDKAWCLKCRGSWFDSRDNPYLTVSCFG